MNNALGKNRASCRFECHHETAKEMAAYNEYRELRTRKESRVLPIECHHEIAKEMVAYNEYHELRTRKELRVLTIRMPH
ncbi:hypothetical protein NDU88_007916 [Pleurodeles waltl]|uniref:Uncharacterized protein n=1 Tax=Pleurodeles waltl TaxID=8319 RepID=A0AAV7RQT4_PLEWA|nr:hypothetical protein NDU88_007916 [Pleurodeles waltl]